MTEKFIFHKIDEEYCFIECYDDLGNGIQQYNDEEGLKFFCEKLNSLTKEKEEYKQKVKETLRKHASAEDYSYLHFTEILERVAGDLGVVLYD